MCSEYHGLSISVGGAVVGRVYLWDERDRFIRGEVWVEELKGSPFPEEFVLHEYQFQGLTLAHHSTREMRFTQVSLQAEGDVIQFEGRVMYHGHQQLIGEEHVLEVGRRPVPKL